MRIDVRIDAGSKAEAEVIAAALPGEPTARSWRGYGVVRLRIPPDDAERVLPAVADCVKEHKLSWARVRIGDDERTFRARRQLR